MSFFFSAPKLLPPQAFASHYRACLSTLHPIFFAAQTELDPAKILVKLLTLRARITSGVSWEYDLQVNVENSGLATRQSFRKKSPKYFISLLSLSGTPHERACVALVVSFTRLPEHFRLLLRTSSAFSSSFVARRQRSLWDHVLSWASSAFLVKSMVFMPASARSSHATSWLLLCHNSLFSCSLLHSFRHHFGAAC